MESQPKTAIQLMQEMNSTLASLVEVENETTLMLEKRSISLGKTAEMLTSLEEELALLPTIVATQEKFLHDLIQRNNSYGTTQ